MPVVNDAIGRDDNSEASALAQKGLLAGSIALCFGLQMLMHPLHAGGMAYVSRVLASWRRVAIVLVRLLILFGMIAVPRLLESWAPWEFALFQAASATLQCVLLRSELELETHAEVARSEVHTAWSVPTPVQLRPGPQAEVASSVHALPV